MSMQRYSTTMIVLHWTIAILILVAYFTAEGGRHVRADPPTLHFLSGFAVLLLVLPRLIMRLFVGAPPAPSHGALLDISAKLGHAALYLLMIFLPLSGWYAASKLGVTVNILGLKLPSLAAPVQGYPGLIAELHENGGNLILILAGLHAAMALWHQFVLRDRTLERMSPV
jgi:superoxide oxidase